MMPILFRVGRKKYHYTKGGAEKVGYSLSLSWSFRKSIEKQIITI
jgi:hypothetical protein